MKTEVLSKGSKIEANTWYGVEIPVSVSFTMITEEEAGTYADRRANWRLAALRDSVADGILNYLQMGAFTEPRHRLTAQVEVLAPLYASTKRPVITGTHVHRVTLQGTLRFTERADETLSHRIAVGRVKKLVADEITTMLADYGASYKKKDLNIGTPTITTPR